MNWYSINFRILWWTESSKEQHLFEIYFFNIMKVCNVVYFMSLCWIKVFKLPFQKQKATQPKLLNAIVYLKLQVVTMKKYDLAIVLKCICFLVYPHLDWAAQIQSEKPQLRGCILTLCGCPLLPETSCPTPPDRLASSGRWPARKLLQKTTYFNRSRWDQFT